ncbi:hypothetical protein [Streptosporangium sp. KLBMP 9127]|nr:hypothetical protein [Streptosporangium sp. KLBMP 9127]
MTYGPPHPQQPRRHGEEQPYQPPPYQPGYQNQQHQGQPGSDGRPYQGRPGPHGQPAHQQPQSRPYPQGYQPQSQPNQYQGQAPHAQQHRYGRQTQHQNQQTYQQPAGPQPFVIDVGADAKVKSIVGGSVAGGIGLIALLSAVVGAVNGGIGTRITVALLGIVFLAIGLLPVFAWQKLARPRELIFEADGVRWDDPEGRPWAVQWHELAGVRISRTQQRRVKPADYIMRKVMVRLDLFPADPGFRLRHPEMEHLWEFHRVRNGYRLPLGSSPKFIPVIDNAMRQLHPSVYQGVQDEGFMVGLV